MDRGNLDGGDAGRYFPGGRMTPVRTCATFLLAGMALSGCGGTGGSLCDEPSSVAGFVVAFDQGLTNLEADQFLGLRLEALDASATVTLVMAESTSAPGEVLEAARELDELFTDFIRRMEDANWDVSEGLASTETVELVSMIGSPRILERANLVESLVIERCGLPPIVPVDPDTVDSLPGPEVPSPTATDPPTDTIDERSEARSLGTTVGEIYGLTLDDEQVVCLGLALEGVYDASGTATTPENYQRQFQSAFDRCEIDFTVPTG